MVEVRLRREDSLRTPRTRRRVVQVDLEPALLRVVHDSGGHNVDVTGRVLDAPDLSNICPSCNSVTKSCGMSDYFLRIAGLASTPRTSVSEVSAMKVVSGIVGDLVSTMFSYEFLDGGVSYDAIERIHQGDVDDWVSTPSPSPGCSATMYAPRSATCGAAIRRLSSTCCSVTPTK